MEDGKEEIKEAPPVEDSKYDSDDIDAELDNIEAEFSTSEVDNNDDDVDTDEDNGSSAQPDFAPFDRSLKKKKSRDSQIERGLGAHASIPRPQLLDQTDEYEDGVGYFDTEH